MLCGFAGGGFHPAMISAHSRARLVSRPGNSQSSSTAAENSPPWSKAVRIAAPFEYPVPWVMELNLSWNELYYVRAFDNPLYHILFFNDFMAKRHGAAMAVACPTFMRNSGSSFWMQKRS